MIKSDIDIRVRYEETDKMGVVYHAKYFTWFEVARIELLDHIGCTYKKLEEKGYFLPVLQCQANYHMPAHFDDRLKVHVVISRKPVARIEISYRVYREENLLATAQTTHAFIDQAGKLVRPPKSFLERSGQYFS
jgi:acyl-CoA thioester hydrolase